MPADSDQVLLVLSTMPDQAGARNLARLLTESRLAACVNLLPPCQSVYRWRGAVEESTEIPMLIKTTAARYAELESVVRANHPYELPEIIAVPLARGLPGYLEWVAGETA